MKNILFLLLLSTSSIFAQVSTGSEAEFDYGIKNNSTQTVTTATHLTTTGTDGTQGKILPANLPVSTAQQTAIDAKVGDFINDGATTIAPSMNAVYDALTLKQLVFTGIDQGQFLTENDIVIDNTALTLTIATVKNGTAISSGNPVIFYTDGNGISVRHVKTAPVVFTFTNTTGIWYFYFDTSGNPVATQTAPSDSSTIARVYRIYWNSTLAVADKRVIESLEVYKNDATWIDRDWKDTQGAQYSSGFTLSSNAIVSGTPAIDGSNAVVNLTSGTILDANFAYTLTNSATGTTKFTQNLGSGLLPATSGKFITITNNASLILDKIPATDFPFLWNATTNTPEYLTQLGVRTGVSANNFFVYYLYAIQDPRRGETIKIKSAEVDFSNSSLAEAHTWTQLQTLFPTLRDSKIRVLYKLTFEYRTAFDVGTKKSALRKIEDLRKQRTTSTATVGGVIPASTVSFTAAGNISSTNVQLALEELDAEKQPLLGYTAENLANKAVANGYASLGADGKVPNAQIPALAISETFPVASQAAMLGLTTAEQGDVAVRTDISKSFILTQSPASTLANWQELLTPTDAVQSVNGQTGNVNLTTSNIAEGTNLYYTEDRVSANSNVSSNTAFRHSAVTVSAPNNGLTLSGQTLTLGLSSTSTIGALSSTDWNTFNGKAPLASPSFTGTPTAPTAATGTNTTQIATTAFVAGANFWTNTSGTIRNNNANEVELKPLNKVSILNSTGTETAKITATGSFVSTLAGTTGFFGSDEASGMYQNAGNHLVFRSSQDGFQFEPRVYGGANAAGDIIKFKNGFDFSPTSGTGVFNALNLSGTINQTGGANGITRGIYINPTLTSAADFRAIDVTAGTILAPSFTKVGGTSSQFLKADGSVDSNTYNTGTLTTNYIPKATGANSLGNSSQQQDASGNITITGGSGADVLNLVKPTGASMSLSGATGTTNFVKIIADNTTNPDLIFHSGGSERFRISASTGNLLLGTSSDDMSYRAKIISNGSTNNGLLIYGGNSSSNFPLVVGDFSGNNLFSVKGSGIIQINNLAGTGTRTVVTDASGNLSATTIAPTSGTYTPTLTNTTNISSSTLNAAYYTRVGNIVTVTIAVQVTITAAADTVLTFSLPISGATAVNGIGQGNVTSGGGGINAYGIVDTTDTTTARLRMGSTAVIGSGAGIAAITFTYTL